MLAIKSAGLRIPEINDPRRLRSPHHRVVVGGHRGLPAAQHRQRDLVVGDLLLLVFVLPALLEALELDLLFLNLLVPLNQKKTKLPKLKDLA